MNDMSGQNSKLKIFCTYVIVLLPILGMYGFMSKSITLADILIIIALTLVLIDSIITKKLVISNKDYFVFTIWCVLSTLYASAFYAGLFSGITGAQMIKLLVYSLAIIVVPIRYFDFNLATKIYTKIVILLSIIVFVQYFIYLIKGTFYP